MDKGLGLAEKAVRKHNQQLLAERLLVALISNPERYKYIAKLMDDVRLTQEQANRKNVNKALKMAETFYKMLEEKDQ
jgi:hypothetical protein